MDSEYFRAKLTNEGYLKRLYQHYKNLHEEVVNDADGSP